MIFQPLTAQDGPQLADLGAAMAFAPAPQVLGETLSAALAQGAAFGALEEGALAGALLLVRTAPDAARVTCGVRPSHERRGIGSLLLRMADDWTWSPATAVTGTATAARASGAASQAPTARPLTSSSWRSPSRPARKRENKKERLPNLGRRSLRFFRARRPPASRPQRRWRPAPSCTRGCSGRSTR